MPRRQKALTDKEVEQRSKIVGTHAVGGVDGLVLKVRTTKAGLSKRWYLRLQGKSGSWTALGSYGKYGLSLQKARQTAAELTLSLATQGVNPVKEAREKLKQQKAEAQQAKRLGTTVGEVIGKWLDYKESRNWGKGDPKLAAEYRRKEEMRIRAHLSGLFSKPVSSIVPEDIADVLEPIWCSNTATSDRLLCHLHQFFLWCMTIEKCRPRGLNPADWQWLKDLLAPECRRKEEAKQPGLAPEQIPQFMATMDAINSTSSRCTMAVVLTCSRSGNIRNMTWDQLDEKWELWTVPAKDMKVVRNGQHKIPVSPQFRSILEKQAEIRVDLGCPYVFPSDRKPGRPLSTGTLEQVIKRSHKVEKYEGREGWIDRKQSKEAESEVIAVPHGFRSSFETWAHDNRKDARTIQMLLHHDVDKSGLKSSYDRGEDLEPKRQLLTDWGEFCFSLINKVQP